MNTNRKEVLEAYPKYKEQYLRTFRKMLDERNRKGLETTWKTPEEVMVWWLER